MKKAALVGLTGYAARHFDCIQEEEELQLAAVAVLPADAEKHPEEMEKVKATGCTVYDSAEAMFESEKGNVDICFLPTSISSHAPLTVAALDSGFHVLVEKPVAGTLEDVARMKQARDRTGLAVSVGFQDTSREDLQRLKLELHRGTWGKLQSVSVSGLWPRPFEYYDRNDWAGKIVHRGVTINDSPINNAMAHFLNNALHLASPEQGRSATVTQVEGDLYRCYPIESFDTLSLKFETEEGIPIRFSSSHVHVARLEPEVVCRTDTHLVKIGLWSASLCDLEGEQLEDLSIGDVDVGRANMVKAMVDVASGREERYTRCSLEIAEAPLRAVALIHDTLEINNVAVDDLHQEGDQRILEGVDRAIQQCTQKQLTFRELGIHF